MNTQQLIERELRAAGEEGLWQAELRRRVGSPAVFRQVIRRLEANGSVTVETQSHPQWGQVKLYRWRGGAPIEGQQTIDA